MYIHTYTKDFGSLDVLLEVSLFMKIINKTYQPQKSYMECTGWRNECTGTIGGSVVVVHQLMSMRQLRSYANTLRRALRKATTVI